MSVSENFSNESGMGDSMNRTAWLSSAAYTGSAVYLTIVGILAIFGNTVVLVVIVRDHRLRSKPHNILLINLAIADMLCLLGGYWVTATAGYLNRWVFGDLGCIIIAFWTYFCSMTSMNTLVAICVFRYVMICLPGKSFLLSPPVTRWVIMLTWFYSGFWSGLPLLGWGGYAPEPFHTSCSLDWADHSYTSTTYMVTCIIFCYVIHVVIMIKCYRSISATVKKIADRERERGRTVFSADEVVHSAAVTDDQQVTRMCFLVVLVFVGVWTPYAVICAIHIFYSDMPLIVTTLPTLFAKSGCMLNPLTYFVTNKSFRAKAVEMLCNFKLINAVGTDMPAQRCFPYGDQCTYTVTSRECPSVDLQACTAVINLTTLSNIQKSTERFDKITKEGVYIGTELVTVDHQVTMF